MGKPALIIRDYIVVNDDDNDKTNSVKKYNTNSKSTTYDIK